MLNKIQFESHNQWGRPMNDEHRKKIWEYVKKYMNGWLKDTWAFLWDEKLQREQFLAHRKEVIHFFAEKLAARNLKYRDGENASKIIDTNIQTYPYYADLKEMGIDPHAVFDADLERKNAEADYQRWKSATSAESIISSKSIPSVQDMVQRKSSDTISGRTPTSTIKPKAWPRMRRSDWKQSKKPNQPYDDDLLNPAGAGDAAEENSGDGWGE